MLKRSILTTAIAFIIAGCSDNSGGGAAAVTATGQFKDSNTAGLSYVSGGQAGITDAQGNFTYEVGNTVTFSIGGVTLGTSLGKSIVTPVDLVPGGSTSSSEVQNIVRFLIMLDNDSDPANGISISSSMRDIARNWPRFNFNVADLKAELSSAIALDNSSAANLDGRTHTLPLATAARSHLESTLLCSYAGAYKGIYSGDDNGNFGVMVDALNGNVAGVAYSIPLGAYTYLNGMNPISYDQSAAFVTGNASNGATFSGRFGGQSTSVDGVSGSWHNNPNNGNFWGARIGGAKDAAYRFTGYYSGGGYGLFSFDVDSSGAVTGIAYSVAADKEFTISGAVSGTSLSATTSDGTVITGTLNTTSGSLSGTWQDAAENLSGVFSGNGCRLNYVISAPEALVSGVQINTATSGQEYRLNAANYFSGDNLTYSSSAINPPYNTLTINPSTGMISGRLSDDECGNGYSFIISATNESGVIVNVSVRININ